MQLFIVYLDIFFKDMSPRAAAAKTETRFPDIFGEVSCRHPLANGGGLVYTIYVRVCA